VISLLLDEGVSPSLVQLLSERDIDAIALRDRARLQLPDHAVWQLAATEGRAVVTTNGKHFLRLATAATHHSGVVVLPGGCTRAEQFGYVVAAVEWVTDRFPFMPTFANYFVEIEEGCVIVGREVFAAPEPMKRKRRSVH
jgi:predicted nuclease of predicted toxin-antitoxin system